MMKRIFALLICLATVLCAFAGCSSNTDDDYKGQAITAYLTTNVYDLDPARAYTNDALADVVGLMFDTLFKLDSNKKVVKSLVKEYEFTEDKTTGEHGMWFRLKDTKWSDGQYVSANDVVFAWKRLLEVESSFEAASLLFDIKNARAAKEGDASIDDVGIYAEEELMVTVKFEGPIDKDQFLLNLTSLALAPLREDIVSKGDDWAKKPATIVCSGPFRLGRVNVKTDTSEEIFDPNSYQYTEKGDIALDENGNEIKGVAAYSQIITDFVLERNAYYYRDPSKDESLFKSVKPYRICVDCSLTSEQLMTAYEAGIISYIGNIPLDLRDNETIKNNVKVADTSLSTNMIYLNQNAMVNNGTEAGYALFANEKVRQALSLAVDRATLAKDIVYAEAATGIVPTGVFASGDSKKTFRGNCTNTYEYLKLDTDLAVQLLEEADIGKTSWYSFSISYPAYDDVQKHIAETVAEAWSDLGFDVEAKAVGTVMNNDWYKPTESIPEDICDDTYAECLRSGQFEAIVLDYCAASADPYGVLAPFAKAFSGQGMDMSDTENYQLTPHVTGYDSEEYNKKMEDIYDIQNAKDCATALYEAEKILMTDMPAIPTVFNKRAVVQSDDLKSTSATYYLTTNFQKAELKNYEEYLEAGKKFVTDNFEELTFRTSNAAKDTMDVYKDIDTSFENFKTANTIYMHFFAEKKEEK
ncbi:MAG: hypothetical protein IJX74_02815 [Clostridia bacterium]|nr:hypothetical protein [Clostridia bacterium]